MNREEAKLWAVARAREIVLREGSELALSARQAGAAEIEADSTLLGAAIAAALIEAFENGAASAIGES